MRFREILFTAFYSGYFPFAPGTAGTLVGMIFYVIEYLIFKENCMTVNAIIVIFMLFPAIKLGDMGEKFFGRKDPSEVVLDEVMGYWISVLFIPFSWKIAIMAFFIFRIMDILKPFPAGSLQRLKGGWGIMIDDYIAGIYTNLILQLIIMVTNNLDMPIY